MIRCRMQRRDDSAHLIKFIQDAWSLCALSAESVAGGALGKMFCCSRLVAHPIYSVEILTVFILYICIFKYGCLCFLFSVYVACHTRLLL